MNSAGRADNVENEVAARDINEWIEATGESFGVGEMPATYVCECSAPDCRSTVTLTKSAYEVARTDGRRFVICTNHENPELDYLVWQGESFAMVQTLPGRPSRVACDNDPRLSGTGIDLN